MSVNQINGAEFVLRDGQGRGTHFTTMMDDLSSAVCDRNIIPTEVIREARTNRLLWNVENFEILQIFYSQLFIKNIFLNVYNYLL